MKTFIKLQAFLLVAMLAGSAGANVLGGVDPGYVKVKVFEIRVSPNDDCSNGVTVYRNAAPSYQDWSNSPTIGSGAIPNGTYNCVMMKMDDQIHVTPSIDNNLWQSGVCTVGQDYVLDVAHDDIAIDPDGTQHTLGTRGTEDIVWLYIRRLGSSNNGPNQHTWQPGYGIKLTSPLVVTGDRSQTMVFDFSGAVGQDQDFGGPFCGCDAPTMGFR